MIVPTSLPLRVVEYPRHAKPARPPRHCAHCSAQMSAYAHHGDRVCAPCRARGPCRVCKGRGYVRDESRHYVACYRCSGTGVRVPSLLSARRNGRARHYDGSMEDE